MIVSYDTIKIQTNLKLNRPLCLQIGETLLITSETKAEFIANEFLDYYRNNGDFASRQYSYKVRSSDTEITTSLPIRIGGVQGYKMRLSLSMQQNYRNFITVQELINLCFNGQARVVWARSRTLTE